MSKKQKLNKYVVPCVQRCSPKCLLLTHSTQNICIQINGTLLQSHIESKITIAVIELQTLELVLGLY